MKLRQINNLKSNLFKSKTIVKKTKEKINLFSIFKVLCDSSLEIIQPLLIGCDTKQPKIIQICLVSVQKIIEAKILNLVREKSI